MLNFAANLSFMFGEVEFLDRFKVAADSGFRGVEYMFPYDHDAIQLRETLNEHRLTQILAVFEVLERLGYSGWIGCEYTPAGRTSDGLRWLTQYRRAGRGT